MSRVVVLGSSGMLGGMVVDFFKKKTYHEVFGVDRNLLDVYPRSLDRLSTKLSAICGWDNSYVINCIGAIKPVFASAKDISVPIYVNAVFPHQLTAWSNDVGARLIHITTDCVFSGKSNGAYDENTPHDATDVYGRSKSLGEPTNCMTLRTSIIGPEYHGKKRSLLEWVKGQNGKTADGFMDHCWNGMTTLQLAKQIFHIMDRNLYQEGVFHIFGESITKAAMIREISTAYGLNITVNEIASKDGPVDRRIFTKKELQWQLPVPPCFFNMIGELATWEKSQ